MLERSYGGRLDGLETKRVLAGIRDVEESDCGSGLAVFICVCDIAEAAAVVRVHDGNDIGI
jgi:hypothetical protein